MGTKMLKVRRKGAVATRAFAPRALARRAFARRAFARRAFAPGAIAPAIALAAAALAGSRVALAGQLSSMENDVNPVHQPAGTQEPNAYTWGDSFDTNQIDHNYSLIGVTDGSRSMSLVKPAGGFSWGTQFLLNDPLNDPRYTDLVGAGTTDVDGNFFLTQASRTKVLMDMTTPGGTLDYEVGFGAMNYGGTSGYFIDSYNPAGGGNYYQYASQPTSISGLRTQTYTWDLGGEFPANGLPIWDRLTNYVIFHFNVNSGNAALDAPVYYDNLRVVNEDIDHRSTWNLNSTSGNWTDGGAWQHGVPNAVGAPVIFYNANAGTSALNVAVTLNSAVTVGSIIFDSQETAFTANAVPAVAIGDVNYNVAGTGALTFDVAGGNAELYVIEGTNTIGVPVTVNDNMVIDTSAGFGPDNNPSLPGGGRFSEVPVTSISFTGPLTLASGVTLSTRGGGTVGFAGISGPAAALTINGGGATLNGSANLAALTVASSANLSVAAGGNKLIQAGALSINTTSLTIGTNTFTASGHLDLSDNDMIVGAGDKAVLGAQIAAARAGGAWSGRGLGSSAAAAQPNHSTTLGLLSGAEYSGANGGTTTFDGAAISGTNLLVKYTWYGDTDLNGVVNFDDYVRTDNGFNNHLSGWLNGDFDYNNVVNFDDYVLIDLAFNTQSGTLGRALAFLDGSDRSMNGMTGPALQKLADHFGEFGTDYAQHFLASVPEPAGALLGVPACSAVAMRRRRKR